MRYDPEHKQRTHQMLLNAAAEIIREEGPEKISVGGLMSRAGLTHGGFYAHFKSKDALVAAAITHMFEQQYEILKDKLTNLHARAGMESYVQMYLSTAHRDHREKGCPVAALSGDLPRLNEEARQNFSNGVKKITGLITSAFEELQHSRPEADALLMISQMVGAVVLSRTVPDKAYSEAVLDNAREAARTFIMQPA